MNEKLETVGPLMKNVALLGGLLQIVARTPGEER